MISQHTFALIWGKSHSCCNKLVKTWTCAILLSYSVMNYVKCCYVTWFWSYWFGRSVNEEFFCTMMMRLSSKKEIYGDRFAAHFVNGHIFEILPLWFNHE
jgi:hypothetical protein